MSIRDEVSAGASDALNPLGDHIVNSIFLGLGISKENPLLSQLSGKEIVITVKIPDLTK